MALIKCPECKKKISDYCENCPHCGYPIKEKLKKQDSEVKSNEKLEKTVVATKAFYKNMWVWIVVVIVLATLAVGTFLFLNRETKPKFDEEGNPVFVELTNAVYTNAEDYLGYHVNIKGKVFQVMGDYDGAKGIQIWLDPETCEQNLMIFYSTDVEIKQDDYIICSGYIDSIMEYENAYNAKTSAPLVYSFDLEKSTYKDVVAPTTDTIVLKNVKQEKYGYSVLFEKVEFSEKETRVYVTVKNNGKESLYVDADGAVIVQNGKQYNAEDNYDANYDKIPYEVVKGASSSGVIVFPPVKNEGFDFTIDVHSDESDEKLGKITVRIKKINSGVKEPWPYDMAESESKPTYPSAVGEYYYCDEDGCEHYLSIKADGTLYLYYVTNDPYEYYEPLEGIWTQTGDTIEHSVWNLDGGAWNNPFYGTVYEHGVEFIWDYYTRQ